MTAQQLGGNRKRGHCSSLMMTRGEMDESRDQRMWQG
jgi:hypothetical protein